MTVACIGSDGSAVLKFESCPGKVGDWELTDLIPMPWPTKHLPKCPEILAPSSGTLGSQSQNRVWASLTRDSCGFSEFQVGRASKEREPSQGGKSLGAVIITIL